MGLEKDLEVCNLARELREYSTHKSLSGEILVNKLNVGFFGGAKSEKVSEDENFTICKSTVILFVLINTEMEWKDSCEELSLILDRIRKYIVDSLEDYCGVEIESDLDYSVIRFDSSVDGIRWSLRIAEGLGKKIFYFKGMEVMGVGVKIGMSRGRIYLESDGRGVNYGGPVLCKAARLCHLNVGKGILISKDAYEECKENIHGHEEIIVKSVGEYDLKGFSELESVYSIIKK
jgi:class 3 adenylate cyclase